MIKIEKAKTDEEKAKAEALLESIGEGIIAIDLHGEILLMNQNLMSMHGIRTTQEEKLILSVRRNPIFGVFMTCMEM